MNGYLGAGMIFMSIFIAECCTNWEYMGGYCESIMQGFVSIYEVIIY